jgi:hypothetical protein
MKTMKELMAEIKWELVVGKYCWQIQWIECSDGCCH